MGPGCDLRPGVGHRASLATRSCRRHDQWSVAYPRASPTSVSAVGWLQSGRDGHPPAWGSLRSRAFALVAVFRGGERNCRRSWEPSIPWLGPARLGQRGYGTPGLGAGLWRRGQGYRAIRPKVNQDEVPSKRVVAVTPLRSRKVVAWYAKALSAPKGSRCQRGHGR